MDLINKISDAFITNGYYNIKQTKDKKGNILMSGSKINKSKVINLTNMANIFGNLRMFHFDNEQDVMNEIDITLVRSFNLNNGNE